jgi:hypothetical protein
MNKLTIVIDSYNWSVYPLVFQSDEYDTYDYTEIPIWNNDDSWDNY